MAASISALCRGPEPVEAAAAGYSYVQADSETNALLALRGGLQAQLEQLDEYIVQKLEEKLAAASRRQP